MMPEIRQLLLHQVEASLPKLSEEFYQMLADDIDKHFAEQEIVVGSLIEQIDNEEKRTKLFKEMELMIKTDITIFMNEVAYQTELLQGKLKTLIETPENKLTAEERKMKEILIYFLYLVKKEKG